MREIKFRAWDGVKYITFDNHEYDLVFNDISGWNVKPNLPDYKGQWICGESQSKTPGFVLEQYTGLKDKNGIDIYEGDIVRIITPYRTTQTHQGDNIPNGSYTEPMEPGIRIDELEIVFEDGCFNFGDAPLFYHIADWDLESIKDAISWTRQTDNWFDDPDEGDLQYLINEVAKVNDEKELIEYLSGIEIIGNIHEHKHLI